MGSDGCRSTSQRGDLINQSPNPNRRSFKPPPDSALRDVPWVPPRLRWLALRMYAAGWHDAMNARAARGAGARRGAGSGYRPLPGARRARDDQRDGSEAELFEAEEWFGVDEPSSSADVSGAVALDEVAFALEPMLLEGEDLDEDDVDDDNFARPSEEQQEVPVQKTAATPSKPRRTTRRARTVTEPRTAANPKAARSDPKAGRSNPNAGRSNPAARTARSPASTGTARKPSGGAAGKGTRAAAESQRGARTRKGR